jgi:hypothetical protein
MLRLFYPAVLITLLFFLSGFEKIYLFPTSTAKFAKKMGLPLFIGQLLMIGAIALELIAPLIIMAFTFTGVVTLIPMFKLALLTLMAFTVIVTLIFHNPLKNKEKYYAFMSNMSTLGGLLALYYLV